VPATRPSRDGPRVQAASRASGDVAALPEDPAASRGGGARSHPAGEATGVAAGVAATSCTATDPPVDGVAAGSVEGAGASPGEIGRLP